MKRSNVNTMSVYYLMLCFLAVSGSFTRSSNIGVFVFTSSKITTCISAGLKIGGSFLSTTLAVTVAVEVDTGPEKGASFVATTSSTKTGMLSKSNSLEMKERTEAYSTLLTTHVKQTDMLLKCKG